MLFFVFKKSYFFEWIMYDERKQIVIVSAYHSCLAIYAVAMNSVKSFNIRSLEFVLTCS